MKALADSQGQSIVQEEIDPNLAALQGAGLAPDPVGVDSSLPRSPSEALPLLDSILRLPARDVTDPITDEVQSLPYMVCLIINQAEFIVPMNQLGTMNPDDRQSLAIIQRWGKDRSLEENRVRS